VFQGSYQTKRVREDLLQLAFGPTAAGRNDNLFQNLRSMSLSRDAGAPVDPSTEDLQSFEERNDVRSLRAALDLSQQARDTKALRSIKSQIENLIETLSNLKVQERRTEFFNRVDSLRAQGLPTVDPSMECGTEKTLSKKRCIGGAEVVAQFLQACDKNVDEDHLLDQCSRRYMELLVDYLSHRLQASSHVGSEMVKIDPTQTVNNATDRVGLVSSPTTENSGARQSGKVSQCLLGCGPFRGRSELTKHYQRMHVRTGTFDRPFPCPECIRRGIGDFLIEGGPSAWSNHVETVHSKIHAPNLLSHAIPVKGSTQCLLCEGFFVESGGLARHVLRTHDRKEGWFRHPFPCPECIRQGKGDIQIDGRDGWYAHVASVHSKVDTLYIPSNQPFVDRSGEDFRTGKGERDDEDVVAVLEVEDGTDGFDDTIMLDASDGTTDAASGIQTPASLVDSSIMQRIDPRLLPDDSRQCWESTIGNKLDHSEIAEHGLHWSLSTTKSAPVVFDQSESTEHETLEILETLETPKVSSAEPLSKHRDLSPLGMLSYVDLTEPTMKSTACPINQIMSEPVQEVTEVTEHSHPKEITMPRLVVTSHVSSSDSALPDPNHEDTRPVCHQSWTDIDASSNSQQLAQTELAVEARPSPAITPDTVNPTTIIAKLWGRGYALAPEGSELNRLANNAQRREEISSNISSEHVITGKRQRRTKDLKQYKRTRR
jgi:hypothetical protein